MHDCITYKDIATKQIIEKWADDKGFVAEEQLALHMEERFRVTSIHVVAAVDQGDFLLVRLVTDCWQEAREFALLPDGALSW